MDRRPHWDDDLVDAVIHEIGVLRPSPPPLANTAYAVIAAVEDWQVQHARDKVLMVAGNPGTYVGGLEAAIQRVQAVCDKPNRGPSWDSYVEGYNDAISVVQAAMEGEVDA